MFTAAVTGTNGKTSVVELFRQIMEVAGVSAASWGTLGLVSPSGRTSDPWVGRGRSATPRFLDQHRRRGIQAFAFEAHSAGLLQELFDDVALNAAVFTTFGRDHLDIHGTRESYFQAKKRLFEQVADQETEAIINAEINWVDNLISVCRCRGLPIRTYGTTGDVDVQLLRVRSTDCGIRVQARFYEHKVEREVSLFTRPMAENLLAASLIALSAGLPISEVLTGWKTVRSPLGRMERVAHQERCEIYVDYAHTPGALKSLLLNLGERSAGRRLLVFGCGGDRDKGKRAPMGRIAQQHAERTFVTDDNPRGEEPAQIRAQILKGCPEAEEVPDRRAAIHRAIKVSRKGDVIVIAGKGHEDYQIRDDTKREFSDRQVALDLAKEMLKK